MPAVQRLGDSERENSGVEVVHGCFTGVSNSILSTFSWLSYRDIENEAAKRLTSLLASRLKRVT